MKLLMLIKTFGFKEGILKDLQAAPIGGGFN